MARTKKPKPVRCEWKTDDDGVYHTACGEEFQFIDSGPVENKMRFCCYCGAPLKAKAESRRDLPEYCGDCDGCGWVEGGAALQTTCSTCGGTGCVKREQVGASR